MLAEKIQGNIKNTDKTSIRNQDTAILMRIQTCYIKLLLQELLGKLTSVEESLETLPGKYFTTTSPKISNVASDTRIGMVLAILREIPLFFFRSSFWIHVWIFHWFFCGFLWKYSRETLMDFFSFSRDKIVAPTFWQDFNCIFFKSI